MKLHITVTSRNAALHSYCLLYLISPGLQALIRICRNELRFRNTGKDSEFLNRMGRRYGMWDPYSVPESEKNKGSEIWLKARPEMKTHCVRADSSQALTSDSRSFVFLTDSSKSQGSHIPYLRPILSGRNSWLFPFFQSRSSFRNSS